ncbi:galactokinase [Rhodococcus sp. X156]|uniref:galactokinase n=1 Tax=Rhodococcus sp. X156 TaxID=2499145 RepID=UPI001F49BAB3|nr:galactokinase [Rhodococcus sp. X156]
MSVPAGVDPAAAFAARFGRPPEGVWAAPGRVNLIGEHTDYNDGYVLPVALPHSTVAAVARTAEPELVLASVQYPDQPVRVALDALAPGAPDGWAAYPAGVVHQLRREGHRLSGLQVLVDGQVPVGAGLSSSAALTCSVALALRDLFALPLRRAELVDVARAAENDFAGAPTGVLDHSASLLCTVGHALLLDTRDRSTTQVPLDLAAAGLALLVLDTGAPHQLATGGGPDSYARRRQECGEAAAALGVPSLREVSDPAAVQALPEPLRRRARHVVTENARVLAVLEVLRSGTDPRAVGPLLTAGHRSLREDFAVSTPALDVCVDAAVRAGAHGARMVGGGFGGSALALVDDRHVPAVRAAVAEASRAAGHRAPTAFVVVPSAGARRVE